MFTAFLSAAMTVSPCPAPPVPSAALRRSAFQAVIGGRTVDLVTIRNGTGLVVRLTNHGARLVQLIAPDRHGALADIVLGYASLDATLAGQISAGAMIGRFAGRIANASFVLDGTEHRLTANDGANHLHGGTMGASRRVFDIVGRGRDWVRFRTTFEETEDGYPGTAILEVTYRLSRHKELIISSEMRSDRSTIVNLANHSFWNLSGRFDAIVSEHRLVIPGEHYLPISADFVPDGRVVPVASTAFDFRRERRIGELLDLPDDQLKRAGGFSHSFMLANPDGRLQLAASLYEPCSGRTLDVLTTEPAVHLNTANGFSGREVEKGGQVIARRGALTLQTMHPSNAPNEPGFPSTRLDPGTPYRTTTIFRFGTR